MKNCLLVTMLVMACFQAAAADVDLSTAQRVARDFIMSNPDGHRIAGQQYGVVSLLYAEPSSTRADKPLYYIFNSGQGFVIVAGDDRAQQILAYGDRPMDMKRMPGNMRFWLGTYKKQLEFLMANPDLVVEKPQVSRQRSIPTVHPMLTALWDQAEPYNTFCPVVDGSLSLTGCPATSLSMVFYYWKYPTKPTPDVPSYINTYSGSIVPALTSTTFDWDNMLDEYNEGEYTTEQGEAVAWLMRYVG